MDVVLSRYSVDSVGSPLTALIEGCSFSLYSPFSLNYKALVLWVENSFVEFITSCDPEVEINDWVWMSGGVYNVAKEGLVCLSHVKDRVTQITIVTTR